MARHKRPTAHLNPEIQQRVLAACLELIDELGRMPGSGMIAKRAHVDATTGINTRQYLIQTGLLPLDKCVGGRKYKQVEDDPHREIPDDPDAPEIQARIAEVRAEKEAIETPVRLCNIARARLGVKQPRTSHLMMK